ncbi:CD63 antigen isoform X1 [Halyomorpha halys]|uniref:CD63 antigen isoform X1 n=1 Tax=Halyomorpha halys TaxID=286706 RepID=UPI0006D5064B|nr:CD63 antigen-like isoform X2 [Halyomorpha halys]
MQFGQFVSSGVLGPPIVLIVLGGVIFFIAFLGCCGAIKENFYMLIAFAVLLAIIFVIEIAVGIAASISKDEFTGAMRDGLRASMLNYTKTKLDRQTWDNLHKSLQCCGVDSPRGWGAVVGEGQVPESCCKEQPQVPVVSDPPTCPIIGAYPGGCYEKMRVQVKDNIIIIMGVGLGIAVIELAGIVLACCLASSVKKEQESKQEAVLRVWADKELGRKDGADSPEQLPISTIVTD